MTDPARSVWTDAMLEQKFVGYDNELAALRALPASMASFDIRLTNQNEHLVSLSRDLRSARDKADSQTSDLGEIKVELAKVATTVKVWATLGGLVGAGIVSGVIALLPHG